MVIIIRNMTKLSSFAALRQYQARANATCVNLSLVANFNLRGVTDIWRRRLLCVKLQGRTADGDAVTANSAMPPAKFQLIRRQGQWPPRLTGYFCDFWTCLSLFGMVSLLQAVSLLSTRPLCGRCCRSTTGRGKLLLHFKSKVSYFLTNHFILTNLSLSTMIQSFPVLLLKWHFLTPKRA